MPVTGIHMARQARPNGQVKKYRPVRQVSKAGTSRQVKQAYHSWVINDKPSGKRKEKA